MSSSIMPVVTLTARFKQPSGNFSIRFRRQYVSLLASVAATVVLVVDSRQKKFPLHLFEFLWSGIYGYGMISPFQSFEDCNWQVY